MKKRIAVFLALLVCLALLPETVKAEEPSVADNLIYEVENAYWDGSKLIVEGYIVNLNEEYHILGLEDVEFTVEDADGREFSDECKLNDKFQESFLLRPMSKRPYNFTMSKYRYKKSKYASLTEGVQVSFSDGSCTYGTCAGKRCKECGYTGVDLDEDLFQTQQPSIGYGSGTKNSTGSGTGRPCNLCSETGRCFVCGGDGVDETMKGSIWGTRCTLCDGAGNCIACSGTGIRP